MDQMTVRKIAAGAEARIIICEVECLWTAKELGAYLGLTSNSVTSMASANPDRLPPRVPTMRVLRWVPAVCRAWAEGAPVVKRGRPRKTD